MPHIDITDAQYPIRGLWLVKQAILGNVISYYVVPMVLIPIFFVMVLTKLTLPVLLFILTISFIVLWNIPVFIIYMQKRAFHYVLEEKRLTIQQGWLSKQQRTIPYSTIQSLYIHQDFVDRLLGLATVTIENASGSQVGGTAQGALWFWIGSMGNKVIIPGLSEADAEVLKGYLLRHIKENPSSDARSGL
jgi:uncharacterized membrane protein YdbT with pleckstrin-like domain